MRQARLVRAEPIHINRLAKTMREVDVRECAAFGKTPKQGLRWSLRTAFEAVTALSDDDRPLAMFGVTPVNLMLGSAVPWFLGSDEVWLYARDLMERGPAIIGRWLDIFPVMENVVSADNERAIRMLRKWGAEVGGPTSRHGGVEFIPFRFARPSQM